MTHPEVHEDGTISCWRVATRKYARTSPDAISSEDLAVMRSSDRERLAGMFHVLRGLTGDRTMVRVKIDFVMALPLGSEIPSPQVEAVSSAALAIAGPADILDGARVRVARTRDRRPGVRSKAR